MFPSIVPDLLLAHLTQLVLLLNQNCSGLDLDKKDKG
jgi:hypothetical protein